MQHSVFRCNLVLTPQSARNQRNTSDSPAFTVPPPIAGGEPESTKKTTIKERAQRSLLMNSAPEFVISRWDLLAVAKQKRLQRQRHHDRLSRCHVSLLTSLEDEGSRHKALKSNWSHSLASHRGQHMQAHNQGEAALTSRRWAISLCSKMEMKLLHTHSYWGRDLCGLRYNYTRSPLWEKL